jgi:quercetin dioxygenase-like cupin family protein
MAAFTQHPIVSLPGQDTNIGVPGSAIFHRATSADTNGVFSVVELVTEPGQGASLHVHTHEDELVYLVDGQLAANSRRSPVQMASESH